MIYCIGTSNCKDIKQYYLLLLFIHIYPTLFYNALQIIDTKSTVTLNIAGQVQINTSKYDMDGPLSQELQSEAIYLFSVFYPALGHCCW